MANESINHDVRRDRFIRIVERRVNQILYDLDNLSKCSNKKNYQYSDTDVKKIFTAINRKVKETRSLFQDAAKQKRRFKLGRSND